jgi:hypothetical protein
MGAPSLSPDHVPDYVPDYVHRTGPPPGFKPFHLVVAGVLAVVWFGTLGFVLTHGHHQQSSVDVYSELPPGFTSALEHQGVRYSGLSPVDGATVQQVLSHATTGTGVAAGAANPIVLRTSFTDHGKGASFTDQPALMVVVPSAQPTASPSTTGSGGSSPVYVAFLDPTTYKTLANVTYDASGVSG